ncbi:MAG: tRNA (guanosine(46)-N7)-methyltransferase TrmB [Pseudomonadales bacterium]|nr:tRNA (guanosine(46)-N7)-methyltransferase TrmB [Pseudomonadales bacterium]
MKACKLFSGEKRVYVRQRGRMTKAQSHALERFAEYEITDGSQILSSFDYQEPIAIEIGFGMGHSLVRYAAMNPEVTCIGVDVYLPGIGSLIRQCEVQGLDNIRISNRDGNSFLNSVGDKSIETIMVFFPDPWPKKRHSKRRLVNEEFCSCIARKLKQHGNVYLATDSIQYANQIEAVFERQSDMSGGKSDRPSARLESHYDTRSQRLGNEVIDFAYFKK